MSDGGQAASDQEKFHAPPTGDEIGNSAWKFLHSVAANYPRRPTQAQQKDAKQFMNLVARLYPCKNCAEDFEERIQQHPPDTSSREKFSIWMCERHNEVNEKIGKSKVDCSRWREMWGDEDEEEGTEGCTKTSCKNVKGFAKFFGFRK